MIRALLDYGAKPSVTDAQKKSALDSAMQMGYFVPELYVLVGGELDRPGLKASPRAGFVRAASSAQGGSTLGKELLEKLLSPPSSDVSAATESSPDASAGATSCIRHFHWTDGMLGNLKRAREAMDQQKLSPLLVDPLLRSSAMHRVTSLPVLQAFLQNVCKQAGSEQKLERELLSSVDDHGNTFLHRLLLSDAALYTWGRQEGGVSSSRSKQARRIAKSQSGALKEGAINIGTNAGVERHASVGGLMKLVGAVRTELGDDLFTQLINRANGQPRSLLVQFASKQTLKSQ